MTESRPFGANTLIIPFTWKGAAPQAPRIARMSRMRPAGELFRNGVVNTAAAEHPATSTAEADQTCTPYTRTRNEG